jgi:glycosyltransferase involved in cell wall biosynthesis
MTRKGSDRQRIAAFGFRSIPPTAGCAGADKFASELLPRLAARGYVVTAYNRLYPGQHPGSDAYQGVRLKYFATTHSKGFDTLLHSAKATYDIIRHRTADIVHIQNGGNSIFGLILRVFGRKVFVSQDGVDWKRDKWPFYGKLYLRISAFVTAFGPTKVIFDNVFARKLFDGWFPWARKRFEYIPFGSEASGNADSSSDILFKLGLDPKSYFLFVGRFIPDKGIQYLIPAYERVETEKKLVLVGGSPNPSAFEDKLRATQDPRILFPGFLYGPDVATLMRNAFAYVQPSDIEGLSPVILENMGIGTPVICSDIEENLFVVGDTATTFRRGDIEDLRLTLTRALEEESRLQDRARRAMERALSQFSWDAVVDSHIRLFNDAMGRRRGREG